MLDLLRDKPNERGLNVSAIGVAEGPSKYRPTESEPLKPRLLPLLRRLNDGRTAIDCDYLTVDVPRGV